MLPTNAKLTLVTPPAVEPLGLDDAKNYLRIDGDNACDDALILDLIVAARMECETRTARSFINTGWMLTLDYLPVTLGGPNPIAFALGAYSLPTSGFGPGWDGSIRLPRPPLVSVESIAYLNQSGSAASYDLGSLVVSPGSPGRIAPAFGRIFPFSLPQICSVSISYTSGFGPDASDVPRNVVAAMRLLVAHYWACRTIDSPEPAAINNLLSPSTWFDYR